MKITPRGFFDALLAKLPEDAARCDFGLHTREAGAPMVNNFTEGRAVTMRERAGWLLCKLTAPRAFGRPLSEQFPHAFGIVQQTASALGVQP